MAISKFPSNIGIATLPMVARDDKMGVSQRPIVHTLKKVKISLTARREFSASQ